MKRWIIALSLALVTIIGIGTVSVAQARSVRSDETVTVAKDEVIDNALFAFGTTINIDGTVNGDVFCGGENINITGTVNGDVFCAGTNLTITGKVNGNVRSAAQNLVINSEITRSAMLAGNSIIFDQQSAIGQDLMAAGNEIKLYGKVGRDADLHGEEVSVGAEIGRNLTGSMTSLYIAPSAKIGGDVSYRSSSEVSRAGEASIGGEVKRSEVSQQDTGFGAYIVSTIALFVFALVALLLVSIACVLAYPALFVKTSQIIKSKPGHSALAGVIALFVLPIVLVVLALSFIGLPLALLVLAIWVVVLILSGPVAAYFVGGLVLKKSKSPLAIMAVGSAIVIALYLVPFINLLAMAAVGIFGVGSLVVNMLDVRAANSKKLATK